MKPSAGLEEESWNWEVGASFEVLAHVYFCVNNKKKRLKDICLQQTYTFPPLCIYIRK